jgi:predicted transcriptional regulator
MQVSEIVKQLNLKVFSGADGLNRLVDGGYASDLLSDVMGHAEAGSVWITLQNHKNVMAIASLKEIAAVILVKGIEPESDTAMQSNQEGIPILGTSLETFEVAGKLYKLINELQIR